MVVGEIQRGQGRSYGKKDTRRSKLTAKRSLPQFNSNASAKTI